MYMATVGTSTESARGLPPLGRVAWQVQQERLAQAGRFRFRADANG